MSTLVFSRIHRRLGLCGMLVAGGLVAAACTQSSPAPQNGQPFAPANGDKDAPSSHHVDDGTFELIDGDRYVFGGVEQPDALSAKERAIYEADRQYVRSIVPANTPVELNHADERQHRFVMTRLKAAGKTPESSPELFEILAGIQAQHQTNGFQPGSVSVLDTTSRRNLQYMSSLTVVPSFAKMEVLATGSVKDALYYGYLDSAPWASNGTQLGNMAYVEVYGNMPFQNAKSLGNLNLTQLKEYEGDSLLIEDTVNFGYRETYILGGTSNRAQFGIPVINAPINTVGDACIHICLERAWGDCDYSMLGMWQLKLPLKGQISVTSAHSFDVNKIQQYKAGTAVDSENNPDPGGDIRVVLSNTGGGCDVDANGSIALGMQKFWQSVTLSADQKTFYWDMTGTNVAVFDSSCTLYQENVGLNMNVKLPYKDANNVTGIYNMSVTNNPQADPRARLIPCMRMTNSCLAAGTLVEMAGGSAMPIESIQTGQSVFNPFDRSDLALTVADTAKGTERTPMIRIEDEHGRSLLMTETHPIDVVGRGMVMAKYLQSGDVVTTKEGPTRLVRVAREPYAGTVHNVKLGVGAEAQSLGVDQTTLYANGFLVGDGQVQGKYERIELLANHSSRLPARWRTDYMNSLRR